MAGGTNLFTPISSTCWVCLTEAESNVGTDQLALLAKCTGTPPTTAGVFEHGCLMIQTDSGTGNEALFENTGTSASPVWALLSTLGTSGTTYGLVAKQTSGATPVDVFAPTVPFNATLTSVYIIATDNGGGNISVVDSAGTVAVMAKGSAGAMVGSAIANRAITTGNTLKVVSSTTNNATVFISFLS